MEIEQLCQLIQAVSDSKPVSYTHLAGAVFPPEQRIGLYAFFYYRLEEGLCQGCGKGFFILFPQMGFSIMEISSEKRKLHEIFNGN